MSPDGPEERMAEADDWFREDMEQAAHDELRADDLRDVLVDIVRSQTCMAQPHWTVTADTHCYACGGAV